MKRSTVKGHVRKNGSYVRQHTRGSMAGNTISVPGKNPDRLNSMGRAYDGLSGAGATWINNQPVTQSQYYRMLQSWDSRKQKLKAKAVNRKTPYNINNPRTQRIKQINTPDNFSEAS